MKTHGIMLVLFILLARASSLLGQDVIYSQFYANPVYLNPALAGCKLNQRITLTYRNEWPDIRKGYVSYSAAYDQQIDKIHGGLAFMVNSDVGGGGTYNRLVGSGTYSYRFQASRYVVINAALQVGYLQYRLDWDRLTFGDQIDINTGYLEPTRESMPEKLRVGNADFSAGIVGGFKESFYIGMSVNHLTRPDVSFYEGSENRLKMRWTFHTGILFDFFQGMDGEDRRNLSVSPNLVYVQQGNFKQINGGVYVNMYPFVGGIWMRHTFGNPDSFILLVGFEQKRYKIGYSFDRTLSALTMKSGGAHEITLSFIIPSFIDPNRYHNLGSPGF
jgi:type IX secretion system PorP/SprF family membrane protein